MKSILALGLLMSVNAFATQITLQPGSSATIAAGEMTSVLCEGTADLTPRCGIKKLATGNFASMIGTEVIGTFISTDYAIAEVKKFKDAGLCR